MPHIPSFPAHKQTSVRTLLVSLVLCISLLLSVPVMAASKPAEPGKNAIKNVPVTMTVHETEGRKFAAELNQYRADKNAWYWTQINNQNLKIRASLLNPGQVTYDTDLEQLAEKRLSELLFQSYLTDKNKRPNGKNSDTLTVNGKSPEYELVAQNVTTAKAALDQLKGTDESKDTQPYRQLLLYPSVKSVGAAFATIQGQNLWVIEVSTKSADTERTKPVNGEKTFNVEISKNQYPALWDTYEAKQNKKRQIQLYKNGKPYAEFTGFLSTGTGKNQQILYFKNGVFQNKAKGKITADYNGQTVTYMVKNGVVTNSGK